MLFKTNLQAKLWCNHSTSEGWLWHSSIKYFRLEEFLFPIFGNGSCSSAWLEHHLTQRCLVEFFGRKRYVFLSKFILFGVLLLVSFFFPVNMVNGITVNGLAECGMDPNNTIPMGECRCGCKQCNGIAIMKTHVWFFLS